MNFTIEYLYQTYRNDIYAYLMSLTHNKPLSEDLTSETFLSAIQSLPTYQGHSTIKTWLFGIARNKWYEHLKKARKTVTQEDLLEIYTISDVNIEETTLTKECIQQIYKLLEGYSSIQKGIFLMRVEGYSFCDIASQYSISESSARVIVFRIRNKIKTTLIKEGYLDE